MFVTQTDSQVVGETLATLFTMVQVAPVDAAIYLRNSGVNTLNYDFQQWVDSTGTWQDIGASGSDYNNTLSPNEVTLIQLQSAYGKIQLIGNASGGAFLEFAITRYFNRCSGGPVPLVNI
jgi:hypothetical protein